MTINRALISVWDKQNLLEMGEFLTRNHVEIIATGGTQQQLERHGISVTPVESITGISSIMDGRVKTLDQKIFGGILADRENSNHLNHLQSLGGNTIDVIIVNFYPFVSEAVEKNLEFRKAIEYIDIGGPSMLRAAAKNYHSVVSICHPKQYQEFIDEFNRNRGKISLNIREKFAKEVFKMTSAYDSAIYEYFDRQDSEALPIKINISAEKQNDMRYGENPHQKAAFYTSNETSEYWKQLQGKELSYNNYSDLESSIRIVNEFTEPACVIIKHANPCGFGIGTDCIEAFKHAVSTDPVSYFGGIVGFNREIDGSLAELLIKPFLECVAAPAISDDAKSILMKKKNLRVLRFDPLVKLDSPNIRSCAGGYLVQERDHDQGELSRLKIVTERSPNDEELNGFNLGWKISRFVKSNAVVIANGKQILGVGAGQMSRVDSVKIAIRKSHEAGLSLTGAIIASDAFFPFPDSIEIAAKEGISAVIQPGGSIKDGEVIKVANDLNLAMAFTGIRHFYH